MYTFKYALQIANHSVPNIHDVLILGIGSPHDVLIIITKSHPSPLPPLHLVAKLPEQLQTGLLRQQCRSLLWNLWSQTTAGSSLCVMGPMSVAAGCKQSM